MAINKYFFIKQIEKSGKPYKVTASNIAVLCPFHQDNRPSCNINIKVGKVALGVFHCWACSASGGWNKLAAKLGLEKLKGVEYQDNPFENLMPQALPDLEKTHLPPDTKPWKGSWRGLSESFLAQFKPKSYYDSIQYVQRILFPVTINKELQGYTAVVIPGSTARKSLNKEGAWIKDSLFPFDCIKGDRIVLVEGVFDALRLLSYGIPALALLGRSWDNTRRSLLVQKGLKYVLLCFDGDVAGRLITNVVERSLKGYVNMDKIELPISCAEYDPGNIPINMLTAIGTRLRGMRSSEAA